MAQGPGHRRSGARLGRFGRPISARTLVVAAILAGAVAITATAVAVRLTGEPPGLFTRDVRVLSTDAGVELPAYAGAVSVLNVMLWAMGAAVAFCAAALVPARRLWACVLGVLLLGLAADDAYMLHEDIGPSVGVPEGAFYVLYAVVAGWLLFYSLRDHRDGSTLALVVGGAFLAFSAAVDVLFVGRYLLEDGAKLIGTLVLLTVPILTLGSADRSPTLAGRPRTPTAVDARGRHRNRQARPQPQ